MAVQLPDVSDAELASSLEELERLATTLGVQPVGRVTQRRGALAAGKVLGDGKLKELAAWTGGTGEVPKYEKPGRKKGEDEEGDEDEDEDADAGDKDADE